ncbi:MAG TPA: hypothetical protein VJC05_03220 [Candidatus Andersenbacteria bacterium]|nr:hypothetical protein [Candidatus Andersenbacteria bacterium]
MSNVQNALDALHNQVSEVLKPCQQAVADFLEQLSREIITSGVHGFGSFEENQRFANRLRDLLYRTELRLQCPECGAPAILVCSKAGRTKNGTFQFYHREAGQHVKHGSSARIPRPLRITAPPSR